MVESPGGLYEEVTQRRIYHLFNPPIRSLLRKFWGHENMFDNGSKGIGIDFGYHEGHIVRERGMEYFKVALETLSGHAPTPLLRYLAEKARMDTRDQ
jgi:hypothetical protein